jgi:small-conductance mechanosensitive channel
MGGALPPNGAGGGAQGAQGLPPHGGMQQAAGIGSAPGMGPPAQPIQQQMPMSQKLASVSQQMAQMAQQHSAFDALRSALEAEDARIKSEIAAHRSEVEEAWRKVVQERTALEAEEARVKLETTAARAEVEEAWRKMVQEQSEALEQAKAERDEFEREKSAFAEEKARVQDVNERLSSIVKLNVGGTCVDTSRTTLTSQKGSMLEAMFSGRHKVNKDDCGRFFFDRDGDTFKYDYVLAFLRCSICFAI